LVVFVFQQQEKEQLKQAENKKICWFVFAE